MYDEGHPLRLARVKRHTGEAKQEWSGRATDGDLVAAVKLDHLVASA